MLGLLYFVLVFWNTKKQKSFYISSKSIYFGLWALNAAFSLACWGFQCVNRHFIAGNLEAYVRISSKLKLGTVGDEYADGGGQGQVKTGEQSLPKAHSSLGASL